MRRSVAAFVAVALLLAGLAEAPGALAKVRPCRAGAVRVKVGKRPACVKKQFVLPAPTEAAPALTELDAALTMTEAGLTGRAGKHAAPLTKRVGRSWTSVRSRLLKAMSAFFTKLSAPPQQAASAAGAQPNDVCLISDLISRGSTFENETGKNVGNGATLNSNGVGVSLDITADGGMQIGMQTNANGNTYTFKYESSESDCLKYALPPCPQADGSLDAYGRKGKVGFSMTVTRGGKVLSKRSYAKTITVETKGQVADDAKLDYVDVRYGETTVVENDGIKFTNNATRLTRIDMRSGTYDPGESVSFGSGSQGSDIANTTTSYEADAKDFATFVGKTRDEYRARESKWQTPGTCATLTANPVKNTVTLHPGDTDKFSAQVVAVNGGGTASKARWTLSGPVNATFSPMSSTDAQPSFSYTVTSQPSGSIMSVLVHATSPAGVAEDTWYQPLEKPLNTITGTFTGHATDAGVIYNWTGTATFKRVDIGQAVPGPGGVFQLVTGQATVAVSGSELGSGCDQTGTSTIGLFAQSPWTVGGTDSPFVYSIIAPFNPDPPQATNVDCSDPQQNGTPAGLGSMAPAALQSGDTGSLQQTTTDLYTYSGSANVAGPDPGTITTWSWSFTGQP